MQYSIVIPTYNSKRLQAVIEDLHHFFKEKGTYEIIVVNDGGVIEESSLKEVRLISFAENCGKNYALYEGFKAAKGEYIITIDDDGQHEVAEIDKLLQLKHHDVVIGKYASENGIGSWVKHLTERVLMNKGNVRFTPFKLIKSKALDLEAFEERVPFTSTLLLHSTQDIVEVDVTINKRNNINSRFSFQRQVNLYRNLIASKGVFWSLLVGVKRKKPEISENFEPIDSKKYIDRLVTCLDENGLKYEVHSFASGAHMVDVQIKKEIYCIQFYDQKFGISHVVEGIDLGTIPNKTILDWGSFSYELNKLMSK